MSKQILTLEDLVNFCKNQKIHRFDAQEFGKQICVKVNDIATFEVEDNASGDGFMHLLFKVCHAGENRNKSRISKDNLDKYKKTLNYRPVLASIVTSPDDASLLDFNSHDMEFDDNGNPIYIEKQVGCFTADEPFLKYDEEQDKTYLMAHAVIPEEYTAAAPIIRRKGGTKVSCEIAIDNMEYDENTGILDIIDFSFLGVCLLGDHVTEGMAGSRADIESISDFSAEKNSVVANADTDINSKLFEILEKLNTAISNFNINESGVKEGNEMDKFNELLELYGLTADQIEFEHEGLTDEELEAAFTEAFGDAEEFKKKKKCEEEPEEKDDDFAKCGTKKKKKCDADDEEDFAGCGKKKRRCSVNAETGTVEFELSFDDIRSALYALLEENSDDDSYSWICECYDNYFVYQKETYGENGYTSKYYKQSYAKNGENVEFSGDATEVFSTFVTESEKTALDMMRTQYEELKAFKEQTLASQEQAQKDAILNDEKYADIANTEAFTELRKNSGKFSVTEVENKAKVIFADEIMAKGNYSAGEKKNTKVMFNFTHKDESKSAYGGLFED